MRYFVTGHEMLLYLSGDREEHKEECCFELPDFESKEEAVAAAREFIKEHKNAVNDQKHGIGSVTYWTAEVTRCIEDEDFGWLPCDADGATEDGHGLVPADATAEYICTLDGSREERAFQRADVFGGLHPNGSDPDEILTISIIGRDGSVLLDERFRPTVKTEWPHASAVNGIYPEDVADLPTIETAIPRLREIFAGADEIIGYNVGFDLGFLSAVGVRPREDAIITDTMNLFTWFMGRRYKLVDAADHIGYEWTGRAHGSLADALATLAVQRWLEQWLVAE